MFIAALFTIARTWKQPECPSTDEWMKMWHTCALWSSALELCTRHVEMVETKETARAPPPPSHHLESTAWRGA